MSSIALALCALSVTAEPLAKPFYSVGKGFGVEAGDWKQDHPVQIEIINAAGEPVWYRSAYSTVNGLTAEGTVVTAAGNKLTVQDEYKYQESTAGVDVIVSRTVKVAQKGATHGDQGGSRQELGFSSRYSFASTKPAVSLRTQQFFVPGIWYLHSETVVPSHSLAQDLDASHVLIREDRLPLPLAMVRNPASGATAVLVHQQPDGSTYKGEDFSKRLIDVRMQFGSIGFVNRGTSNDASNDATNDATNDASNDSISDDSLLQIAFQYPGSEGGHTYIRYYTLTHY
jgi:hypothetical protein